MAEPTLQEVLGAGATQDATTVTIVKANLPGLTPSATNTAESLLAGVLLCAKNGLTKTTFDTNINQSIYIEAAYSGFIYRGTDNAQYRNDPLTINLAKADTTATIDPDDY